MEKTYAKLGWNIKCLRESFHETEEKLAYAVGVTRAAICNYENGTRIPARDTIVKLARHFNLTENELIHGDFSGLKFPTQKIADIEATRAVVDVVLPIITSDKAMSNTAFREAFLLHKAMYSSLKKGIMYDEDQFEKCVSLYEDAYSKGITEAAANILWWVMLVGSGYTDYEKYEALEDLQNRHASGEEYLQHFFLQNCDDESMKVTPEIVEMRRERRQFLRENEGTIQQLLQALKADPQYSDLADYYLAFRYLRGVILNNNSDALNKAIGEEMMVAFSLWGNKYVLNFLKISQQNT